MYCFSVLSFTLSPRYVVCRSTRPGTVRLWNVARTRFKGRPVRVEHGLFSSADIALVRDLKLYILSDHGTTNFTDAPTSVYQVYLCTTQAEDRKGLKIEDYCIVVYRLIIRHAHSQVHLQP